MFGQTENTSKDDMPPGEAHERIEQDTDWLLATLVRRANAGNLRTGMTVFVGGTVITGILTSGRAFLEHVGTVMDSVPEAPEEGDVSDPTDSARDAFARFADDLYGAQERGEFEDAARDSPGFIHLEVARFLMGNASLGPENESMFWRGRLNRIDGFTLGYLSADETARQLRLTGRKGRRVLDLALMRRSERQSPATSTARALAGGPSRRPGRATD
jgi:hypothetical protein